MKYNRGDLNSTMNAAMKISTDKATYVYATAYGYTISKVQPPSNQSYYKVQNGKAELVKPEWL